MNLRKLFGETDMYLILKDSFNACSGVLNAGCGGGRNTIRFLLNGYEVFRGDRCMEAIKHAQPPVAYIDHTKRARIVVLLLSVLVALTACRETASSDADSNYPNSPGSLSQKSPSLPATSITLGEPIPVIQLNDRVLVVYNTRSAPSLDVANHYMTKRSIPPSHKIGIAFPSPISLDWSVYLATVQPALRKAIDSIGRRKVLYIVMTYETPWLMERAPATVTLGDASGRGGNLIDAFVADVFDQLNQPGFGNNPYYAAAQSKANLYPPFQTFADYRMASEAKQIFQVWRLDGPTPTLAIGLVDKALRAETDGLAGQGYFDNRALLNNLTAEDGGYASGDWDIYRAAEFTRQTGFAVTRDENEEEFGTAPAPLSCPGALFYAGWYSLDHYNDVFSWNPGAIGIHLDSASAKDLRGGANWAANAIIRGITVTAGATAEPYLENLPHPDGVFRNIYSGANIGDAFYRNTATLRWVVIFIGDPLYRPFPKGLPRKGRN